MLISETLPEQGSVLLSITRAFFPWLNLEEGPWLAGGSVRRLALGLPLDEGDLDLFFKNDNQRATFQSEFDNKIGRKYYHPANGKTADTRHVFSRRCEQLIPSFTDEYSSLVRVQFIKKVHFESAEALLDDFDFTATQFVTDGRTLLYTKTAMADARAMKLRMNREYKIPMPERLLRYCSYGFVPQPGVLSAVLGVNHDDFKPTQTLRKNDLY